MLEMTVEEINEFENRVNFYNRLPCKILDEIVVPTFKEINAATVLATWFKTVAGVVMPEKFGWQHTPKLFIIAVYPEINFNKEIKYINVYKDVFYKSFDKFSCGEYGGVVEAQNIIGLQIMELLKSIVVPKEARNSDYVKHRLILETKRMNNFPCDFFEIQNILGVKQNWGIGLSQLGEKIKNGIKSIAEDNVKTFLETFSCDRYTPSYRFIPKENFSVPDGYVIDLKRYKNIAPLQHLNPRIVVMNEKQELIR